MIDLGTNFINAFETYIKFFFVFECAKTQSTTDFFGFFSALLQIPNAELPNYIQNIIDKIFYENL